MAPSADAGKEVALVEAGEVGRSNIDDRSLIHFPRRQQPGRNQVAQPLCSVWFYFVVIGCRHQTSHRKATTRAGIMQPLHE